MAQIATAAKPIKSPLDPIEIESAIKAALDRAELIERVPELQRKAAVVSFDETGGLVLVIPRHPAVTAFIRELDAMEYETAADLKAARRRLRIARDAYQTRVANRVAQNLDDGPIFSRLVSLSAILMARAAAKHWHKRVAELEAARKLRRQRKENARQIERARPEFVTIGGELYPVSK